MILFAIGRHIERVGDEVGLFVRCSRELFENAEQNALFIKGLSYPGIDSISALRVRLEESLVVRDAWSQHLIAELYLANQEFARLDEATLREYGVELDDSTGGIELDVGIELRQVGFRLVDTRSPYESVRFTLGDLR